LNEVWDVDLVVVVY